MPRRFAFDGKESCPAIILHDAFDATPPLLFRARLLQQPAEKLQATMIFDISRYAAITSPYQVEENTTSRLRRGAIATEAPAARISPRRKCRLDYDWLTMASRGMRAVAAILALMACTHATLPYRRRHFLMLALAFRPQPIDGRSFRLLPVLAVIEVAS